MKKIYFTYTILLSCIIFASCASSQKDIPTFAPTISSSNNISEKLEEYKDDTISCLYDSSILKIQEISPNGNTKYGRCFYDDATNLKNDILTGTCLYVTTQSHTIPYDSNKNWQLSFMTESLFNGLFNIETNDTTKINELDNNIYEYTSTIDNIEYYGRLLYINSSEMTVSVCRILPDETQEYKNCLKSCYESISYIKQNNTSGSIEEKAEEDAKNYKGITSGNLYNSIPEITEKPTKKPEKLKKTKKPKLTKKPKQTKKPKLTKKPKQTKKPKPTKKPRKNSIGKSNKDIKKFDADFSVSKMREDTTGNFRKSEIADISFEPEKYALSYYKNYFKRDDEVHYIVNFSTGTTTCITCPFGFLEIIVTEYVEGEQHSAKTIGGGTLLEQYWVYPDNGDIEKIS